MTTFIRTILVAVSLCFASSIGLNAEVTIEQCVEKAMYNYPLLKKYDLISAFKEIELSDINKSWLPRINVYGQISGQNIVPSFPEALSDVLQNMGQDMRGLGKIQYKVGVDLSQNIWDGGSSKVKREMNESQESLQQAGLNVEMYKVRERVENLYFAILLTDEQIARSRITYKLLGENLEKLKSMFSNGTAMKSDIDMVEAQALTVNQTILQAESVSAGYRKALELLIGESLENEKLAMPSGAIPTDIESNRPELLLFENRLKHNEISNRLANTSLMPRVGLFAQSYYGYPGFNYFQSMMNRDLSFNIIAGIKVSWNIDSYYIRKNTSRRTALNAADIVADREVFLFNSRIQSSSLLENIKGKKDMMKDDGRIIELRTNVRKAAESQLANGVIDIVALLTKISDENTAMLTAKYHEILLLHEIYKLKLTLDR